jgi:thioredoxin-like negative regulator of GroEL
MNKNKWINTCLSLLSLCLGIFLTLNLLQSKSLSKQVTEAKSSYPKIYDELDSLTIDNFKERVDKGKELVVYVGRPTCGDCNEFEPKLSR